MYKSHSNLVSPKKRERERERERERNNEGYIWDLAISSMSTGN
jgi:hypothetical protein